MDSQTFDLQQEAEYVLGMMDMYPDDKEIATMLRMKGLSKENVDKVLAFVKAEGYRKRIRQGRRIMLIGLVLTIVLASVWIFLLASGIYSENDDFMLRYNARTIIGPVFYGLVFAIIQTVFGTIRFVSYSKKLKQSTTNI
jgi:hypothetical protein